MSFSFIDKYANNNCKVKWTFYFISEKFSAWIPILACTKYTLQMHWDYLFLIILNSM